MKNALSSELYSGGINIPFKANASGGISTLYGDEYIRKSIETLASDCDSDNPFQRNLGIALDNVFQIKGNSSWQGRFRAQVTLLFERYFKPANLAILLKVEFPTTNSTGSLYDSEGESTAIITFLSIETNTQKQLTMNFGASGTTSSAILGITGGSI